MKRYCLIFIVIGICVYSGSLFAEKVTQFQGCDSYASIERGGQIFTLGFIGNEPRYIKTTVTGKTWSGATITFEVTVDKDKIIDLGIVDTQDFPPESEAIFKQHQAEILNQFRTLYLKDAIRYGGDIDTVSGATPQIKVMINGINKVRRITAAIFDDKKELSRAFAARKESLQ